MNNFNKVEYKNSQVKVANTTTISRNDEKKR